MSVTHKCLLYQEIIIQASPTNFKQAHFLRLSLSRSDNDGRVDFPPRSLSYQHHALHQCAFALFLFIPRFSSVVVCQWPTHRTGQLSRCGPATSSQPFVRLMLDRLLESCCKSCRRFHSEHVRRQSTWPGSRHILTRRCVLLVARRRKLECIRDLG